MLLKASLPDIRNWDIGIIATDLNRNFLNKAVSGRYSRWSFRETPAAYLQLYFKPVNHEFQINEEIQRMVRFDYLNLANDVFPSLITPFHDIHVVFCRNVLMYFAPEQAVKIGRQFFQSITEKGWLITSPVEVSNLYFEPFTQVNIQDAILYQKISKKKPTHQLTSSLTCQPATSPTLSPKYQKRKSKLQSNGHVFKPSRQPEKIIMPSPLEKARSFADHGKLDEARQCLEQLIETDHMNTAACYFYANVLMESNEPQLAENVLKQVIYLEPGHIMAHFQMGNLARLKNQQKISAKHFGNVVEMLKKLPSEEIVNDSEGMTAGRMIEFCNLLMKNQYK